MAAGSARAAGSGHTAALSSKGSTEDAYFTPIAAICAFSYTLLVTALLVAFNTRVPEAYMDEPFHVSQTQTYCAFRFHEWDPKITTFPGLYFLGVLCSIFVFATERLPELATRQWSMTFLEDACVTPVLRATNLVPALATPWLLYYLLRRLHPASSASDVFGTAATLALLPTHFFYHFLYYTDSAATCSVLWLLLLAAQQRGARAPPGAGERRSWGHSAAIGLVAALALSIRQTNAVWLGFILLCEVRHVAYEGEEPNTTLPIRDDLGRFVAAFPCALATAMRRHIPITLLLVAFSCFVVYNGGVVLGDKSNHKPSAHLAQLLYLSAFASAPFEMRALTTELRSTLRGAARGAARAPISAAVAVAAATVCVAGTKSHPFLLADNRHVTFYVWRFVLASPFRRYALLPGYLLLSLLLYPSLVRHAGAVLSISIVGCCALVLVPSPLLELRYLTLPLLVLRIHSPLQRGRRNWLPTLAAFACVNACAIFFFLCRPYTWVDGTTARFMW